MTKRRRQGMAGSILEQSAELKSDYESVIGDQSSVVGRKRDTVRCSTITCRTAAARPAA